MAYKGATNELWLVECRSHLDSLGVRFSNFTKEGPNAYKLLTEANLRRLVTNRAVAQLEDTGSCLPAPAVTLCLAAGKIGNEAEQHSLREHFKQNGLGPVG